MVCTLEGKYLPPSPNKQKKKNNQPILKSHLLWDGLYSQDTTKYSKQCTLYKAQFKPCFFNNIQLYMTWCHWCVCVVIGTNVSMPHTVTNEMNGRHIQTKCMWPSCMSTWLCRIQTECVYRTGVCEPLMPDDVASKAQLQLCELSGSTYGFNTQEFRMVGGYTENL